jgi:hypothetical protein
MADRNNLEGLTTRLELLGIVPIVLLGSAMHFAFAWSGGWRPLAIVAAVNESVWEHLKLAFWPALVWALVVRRLAQPPVAAYWLAKALGLLAVPLTVVVLYYSYKALLDRNILALDIGIFVVAVAVGQLTAAVLLGRLERRPAAWLHPLGTVLLLAQVLAYSLFTYLPPPLALFEEERSGRYGIPPAAQPLDLHD